MLQVSQKTIFAFVKLQAEKTTHGGFKFMSVYWRHIINECKALCGLMDSYKGFWVMILKTPDLWDLGITLQVWNLICKHLCLKALKKTSTDTLI